MKKRLIALCTCFVMLFALAACSGGGNSGSNDQPASQAPASQAPASQAPANNEGGSEPAPAAPSGTVQGVTDTEILVGNTAATTGAFAVVGVPFKAGMDAYFKWYNDNGGYHGKAVRYLHYDDGFDGAQGLTFTKQLVEDDKVFALVGHFGTNTIVATMDYMEEKGVPMVYAATGAPQLQHEGQPGCNIFPVQPIYEPEGRVLLARAVASADNGMGLGGTKVGCLATTDDAGEGLKAGVKTMADKLGISVNFQDVDAAATDYSAAVNVLKNAGCDVVILAANQAPMANMMAAMRDANYNAKCITSYVSASIGALGPLVDNGCVTEDRPIYTTTWMDITLPETQADLQEFVQIQLAWEAAEGIDPAAGYAGNSFAMAGYVAAKLFTHGLDNLDKMGLDLTWENYIKALEEGDPFHIPMGGELSFANGDRLGVTSLAMLTITNEIDDATGFYKMPSPSSFKTLDDVVAAIR